MGLGPRSLENLEMNTAFWRGRKVFLTGHTGFKGSWLSVWLQMLGAKLTGIALDPPTTPSLFEVSEVAKEMVSISCDVRDLNQLLALMQKHEPEVVIHLAAQSLVRESYQSPVETFTTNVIGTVNCLDASRRCASVRAVVIVTTDKCYRNKEWVWGYRENDELGGSDPYAASKASAEIATDAYRASFFSTHGHPAGVASARAGNVIGGGDWAQDRLVPDAMRAFMSASPLHIRNPNSTRPWQHVLEPLHGYLMLAERLHAGDHAARCGWNFGSEEEDSRPVLWMAEQLARRWGRGARSEIVSGDGLHESTFLHLDCAKARVELGWKPVLDLHTALDWIVEWYDAFHSGLDVRQVTRAQVSKYERMLDK